ncbi:MAG: type I methionyl aminopeptidase [Planctomycetota bacterium]|nr:type I methionyl aminopeptidase [Planctomycetota bacterium]
MSTTLNLKSPREIKRMRPAGLAVWQGLQIARELAVAGNTTGQIDTAVKQYYKTIGGEPLFLNYPNSTPGKPVFPGVTCTSVNEQVVHGIPGDYVLQEGDIISVDTGCRIDNWCGDSAVTLPIGEIDSGVEKLLEVTANTLQMAIDLIPQKEMWSEVSAEMETYVLDHGFTAVENFVGHGIGENMHEPPQVPNYKSKTLRPKDDFRLEPGIVIAVEPMVNLGTKRVVAEPDHWTMSTADGKPSAHFEHTLAITEDGVRVLTEPPSDPNELETLLPVKER